ncbi:MAG: TonB-dependent receptor [Pseudomonas sp.]
MSSPTHRRQHAFPFRTLLLASAIALTLASPVLAQEARRHYDIPAQGAIAALQEFARQSERQLLFRYETATDRRVEAIRGQYTEQEVLQRLLDEAGLEVISDDGKTLVLGKPTPPANESRRDAHTLDKVTVTGSNIKRTDIEGPAPVLVLTAADIERQGASTIYEALATLSQFTGSVQNELSQSGFTPNASVLNMRGLGPGYNLVLLNGHRLADYPQPYNSKSAAVDLNTIPAAAVERIEVLSGGASAIYGSDAVTGVINIITKTGIDRDTWSLRGGTTTLGGGDNVRAQWTGGRSGDKWSLTYSFEHYAREAIYGYQRDFMDSVRDNPASGDATTPSSGVYMNVGSSSNYTFPNGIETDCGNFPDFEVFQTSSGVQRCGWYGYPATQAIQNEKNITSGYLYGTYDFDNGMQAYAQLLATYSRDETEGAAQSWSSGWYYDSNLARNVRIYRLFTPSETGSQASVFKQKSVSLSTGLRGTLFDDRFDWDANITHSQYWLTRDRPRLLTNSVTLYYLGESLGTRSNGYSIYAPDYDTLFTALDPATFASLSTNVHYEAESQSSQASFLFSGDLLRLPAGPLGMAVVAEAGRQQYDVQPDERITPSYTGTDLVYNLTGTGGGGDRDHFALGLEFSIPLASKLNASVAGRYDYYDDISSVGGAFTWSAGLEYRPMSSLLLRGNYATSFRAPDLHYLYADLSGSYTYIVDQYQCRNAGIDPTSTACTSSSADYYYQVYSEREGNPDLTEETGRSFTLGAVWDITDGMSASVDYYNIRLNDAVDDISTEYLLRNEAACRLGSDTRGNVVDANSAACQAYLAMVQRDEEGAIEQIVRIPYNQAMIRTSGLDASWRYQLPFDRFGSFDLKLGYTHVLKLEEQEFPGDEIINARDDLSYFNFRSRANWNVGWRLDGWSANLYGYRYGSLPNYAETGRIAPYIVWNASLSRRITPQATLGLYVNNLFNKLHPDDDTYSTYPYFYRSYSPIGRSIAAQFSYRFD